MRETRILTKKFLVEECHVTSVTEDGKVFVNSKIKKTSLVRKQHKYGNVTEYERINLYYYDKKDDCTKTYTTTVGRVMLAWFTGRITNLEDADHIDNNKFNNRLSNLQKISRKENLLRRAKTQHEIMLDYWRLRKLLKENEKCED